MISDLLNSPAPLTAADALAMCLVSAAVGALLVVILFYLWIWWLLWLGKRAGQRDRASDRTILKRV